MSVASQAHDDLLGILHGGDFDTFTLTNPAGVSGTFYCMSNDIHMAIDPLTGEVVTGRQSTVAVLISDLIDAGMEDVRGIPDSNSKPWTVTVADINDRSNIFKVVETLPDRSAGLMPLILERYEV